MLFSRKISILAICTLIATIPATSFAEGNVKDTEVGTIDMPSKATSNAGSPTTVLSRHYIDRLHVNGAQISNEDINVANNLRFYGASSTAAATPQKEVSIPSITKLEAGQIIAVKPTITSTVASSTIKLNDFAAYPMRYNGAAISTSTDSIVWNQNYVSFFVFDGTYWQFAGGGIDSNTTYSGMTQAEITATTPGTTNRLVSPQLLRQNLARRPQNEAVGSATKPVYVASDGMVTEVTHELNADVPSNAEFTDTTYTFATGSDSGTISVTPEGGSAYNVTVKDAEVTTHKLAQGDATGSVITSSVTDTQYPSALAVYNAITSATNAADISDHTVNGAPLSNEASYFYGSGVGTATNAAKTVQIDSITTAPTAGMTIVVNPATTNTTATNLTLKLNSGTATRIKYNGSTTISADDAKRIWRAGVPVVFVYDGTNWVYAGREYSAGTGISIDLATNAISNAGVRSVATGTGNDGTISVNTNGTAADVAVKGWNKTVKYDGTNAVGSATKGVYVNASGVVTEMTHSVNADVPSTAEFTDTTYTFATGTTSGAFTVTPEGGSAQTVSIYGWADKQNKNTVDHYSVNKNGTWLDASDAITADETYLTETANDTDGSTQIGIKTANLASDSANITSLTSSSTAANKGKLTTAWAVNQAIDNDINRFAKSHFVNAAPLSNENSVYWGMSNTSDSTAAKTVTIDSLDSGAINTGVFVIITPKATTNVPISTLNVNDSGAFPISYNGSTTISAADSSKIWKEGVPSMFVFNVNREWAYVGSDTDTTYTQGSGITISGTTIDNAGVRDIKNPDNTTASTTIADGTIRANINGTVRYPLVRGWNKTVKYDGTNAVGSATKGVYVNASGVVTEMTHSVNADVPSTAEFTDTTYTFATGSDSGTISVTPEGGSAYNVTVKDAEVTTHKLAQGDATGSVITSSATDTQYPSAKAVYNAITSATSAADISDHTVNGAPLSNEATYYYGTGAGAAGTAAKTVTIDSITTAPTTGMTIVVNPVATATTETNLTLSLNGSTPARIKYNGSTTISATNAKKIWKVGVPSIFIYDGTNWNWLGDTDTNTTYSTMAQSDITDSTTTGKLTTGKLLRDNFYTETETDDLLDEKQDKDTAVTHTANTAVGTQYKGVYVDTDGTVKAMTYSVNANVPSTAEFTDTTYTFATGTTDGAFTVTPEGGSAQTVSVYGWANKQNKPATAEVAAGKVLTYNGTGDANGTNNYSAKYIQVPVANNAPNGSNVTVSTLADIWVE